ncbi:sulfite exporter TauE/SafE family protein [Tsuneonella sp. HG222]
MFDISFSELLPFILIGFGAQIVDGALGMAFGVISQTMLVSMLGVAPATASASTHLVEMFTTGTSGVSHIWQRNVDWGLFKRLVPFGVLGGVVGAYVLSNIDASTARPFVMIYLVGVGIYLFVKGVSKSKPRFEDPKTTRPLAMVGGFLDAAGGGGWGPVVTSNLLVQGSDPAKTVGTVNTAEFFLAVSVSVAFIASLGFAAFTVATVGLIIGGVVAAPFGAIVAKRIPARTLLVGVSIVLVATSTFSIYKAWPIL